MIDAGESPETVRSLVVRQRYAFDVLLDQEGAVSAAYRVRAHPTKFLIDKKGKLVFAAMGYRQWNTPEMIGVFDRMIKEP